MKAEKKAKCTALPFVHPRRWMVVGGQGQATTALPPLKSPSTQGTGGWVGQRAGLDW
jgi:hypothetical protein